MSTVYAIQMTRFQADVTPAQAYGQVVFVLGVGDRMSNDTYLPMKKLTAQLRDFDPDKDYILWSGGDPLSCMLTGYVLAKMGHKTFRYLRYEKGDSRKEKATPFYVPVTVTPFPE